MKIQHSTKNKIRLDGEDYFADSNGIIDVPDNKINSSIWTQGFVVAKNPIAEIEKQAQAAAVNPVAPLVVDMPTPLKTLSKKTVDKVAVAESVKPLIQ